MNKFLIESKAVTNNRWAKAINELGVVKACEWPIRRDIYIWESLGVIKALPTRSS